MLSQNEFEELIADQTKHIEGDIVWRINKTNPSAYSFHAKILSDANYPLDIKGRCNYGANKLSYTIIHNGFGGKRIYALDLGGNNHENPDGTSVGPKHKHRWVEGYCENEIGELIFIGDQRAYVPDDITATADDPVGVWKQFCLEAIITHNGIMKKPETIIFDL